MHTKPPAPQKEVNRDRKAYRQAMNEEMAAMTVPEVQKWNPSFSIAEAEFQIQKATTAVLKTLGPLFKLESPATV